MYVSVLWLQNFRNYDLVDVAFEPGVNILLGPNGQGKTNIVEAIVYLSTLSSHRTSGTKPLIRAGKQHATVQMQVMREDRPTRLEVNIIHGKANKASVNDQTVTQKDLLGHIRSVVFAPEDLYLVKGDPDTRRKFLDQLVVTLVPRLLQVQQDYDKIVKHRSALLKNLGQKPQFDSDDLYTLEVWDAKLAQSAAQITALRLQLIGELQEYVSRSYQDLTNSTHEAKISYEPSLWKYDDSELPVDSPPGVIEARIMSVLSQIRNEEIRRGVCLVGPHRDDLRLELNGLDAKSYASHGESWSFALALKIGSYRLLTSEQAPAWAKMWPADSNPVLILDDVFAELDEDRRAKLVELIHNADQVFITAAVAKDVPQDLIAAKFDVSAGQIQRVI